MPNVRIPGGDAGTMATLRVMRRMVNRGVRDPLTVRTGSAIIAGVLGNPGIEAEALRGWIEHHVRFQRDPQGVELVREVREQLEDIQTLGAVQVDCDDVAVLAAALGRAVGMAARFVVYGFGSPRAPYRHVFTELWNGHTWREIDVTRPMKPFAPSRIYVFPV